MLYLLTIFIFTNPDDLSFYETTSIEVESFEECINTGYNILKLYDSTYIKAEVKCDKISDLNNYK